MKKIFLLLFLLMLNFNVKANNDKHYEKLVHAIAYIESAHNPNAISRNGKHVGYLQISTKCVDECNRLIRHKKYKYKDRYDIQKSIEMFYVIQNHYNPQKDIHLAIRIWNEGISAINKKYRMTDYMKKVLKVYNK